MVSSEPRATWVTAGIVRQIKARNPTTEIVFLYMFLRGDLGCDRRTGTQAWVNGSVAGDVDIYQRKARIYRVQIFSVSRAPRLWLYCQSAFEPTRSPAINWTNIRLRVKHVVIVMVASQTSWVSFAVTGVACIE